MTPRTEIDYCMPNDSLKDKIEVMNKKRFDGMPLLQGNKFIKCLTITKALEKLQEGFKDCNNASVLIKENDKISENLTIKNLIEDNPFQKRNSEIPLFIENNENQIVGLITSADLDKVASRMYFYILFSELEHSLLKIIAEDFEKYKKICNCNTCKMKRKSRINHIKRQIDEELDEYHYLFLIEILHMISKSPSSSKVHQKIKELLKKEQCKELNEFRNHIMHPKPIVSKKYPIKKIAEIQNLVNQILTIFKNES